LNFINFANYFYSYHFQQNAMTTLSVDASNSCIPPTHKLIFQTPPLPKPERGLPISLDGTGGRINSDRPLLVYPSGRLVVVRELDHSKKVKSFVYRGHTAQVTVAKFSPSGCYVASGDVRGKLRVWSYDNEEHLCKLDLSSAMTGPIRDISWDMDSKRLVIVGEGSKTDPSSVCAKVIQWDTGVKVGDLGQHARNKASTCAFKPNRPMRIVTGGAEDFTLHLNAGPPFSRVSVVDGVPAETCHERGAIHCVRYNKQGTFVASVGTDKSVVFYNGKTLALVKKMENVHDASIYSCAWNDDGTKLLTCSADGTVKIISVDKFEIIHTWNVAELIAANHDAKIMNKVPLGGMMMGCAYVQGDIPVAVGLNGHIAILQDKIEFLTGHQAPISCMSIDEERGIMYTGDSDGVIVQWDVSTGNAFNVQGDRNMENGFDGTLMNKLHQGAITGVSAKDGKLLSTGWDDKLRFTESCTMKLAFDLQAQPNAIATGGNIAAIMTVNGIVLVKDNQIISQMIDLSYEAVSICMSRDDSKLYVGGRDNIIHVYSVDGNCLNETHQMSGIHQQPVYSIALSNDGKMLASADVRDVIVWNIDCNYETIVGKSRWCFHKQRINALAWSHDDNFLASGSNDDSIFVWCLKKKTTRIEYAFAHRGGVTGLRFINHSDGYILMSVGADACVNQWDLTDDIRDKFS
jgi:WD40 repeat protein